MTLDEAIEYEEEMVEIGETYEINKGMLEEYRQFAEWLKELKALKTYKENFCEDAISRQAVLEVIEKCHCEEWVKADIGAPIEALQPVNPTEKVGHWIPVSERLPEDGLYLVTTSKGQVQVHVFNHNGNSEEYWMRCNKAWMPLPEPYKAESEE